MEVLISYFNIVGMIGASDVGNGVYRIDFIDSSRLATGAEVLEAAKFAKINELKLACDATIQSGFISTALGSPHTYDSEYKDQSRIIGAKLAGIDLPYPCIDSTGIKLKRLHTAAQIGQIYYDGMIWIQTHTTIFYAKKATVEAATTITDVSSVSW